VSSCSPIPRSAPIFQLQRLGELLDPRNYTGLAAEFVDRVLARGATSSD
jgi:hypothetical protein